jgi:CBS domain containing-hemolysin-like protein
VQNDFEENDVRILGSKKFTKTNKKWLCQIFVLSLVLSIAFSLLAQLTLSHTNLAISLILIIVLIVISVIADIVGVAVTACSVKPLLGSIEKHVFGARMGLKIVKNADKASSICSDVIGDICSILSGAGGVSITIQLSNLLPAVSGFVLALLVNAVIASLSIVGKAVGKTYALNYPFQVVLSVGKFFSIFSKRK